MQTLEVALRGQALPLRKGLPFIGKHSGCQAFQLLTAGQLPQALVEGLQHLATLINGQAGLQLCRTLAGVTGRKVEALLGKQDMVGDVPGARVANLEAVRGPEIMALGGVG